MPYQLYLGFGINESIIDILYSIYNSNKLKILYVADSNTYKFLLNTAINNKSSIYVYDDLQLKPTLQNIHILINAFCSSNFDIIIGIGSGTISDICKYTSYLLHINYGIIATAPSMNGYTSANASIIGDNGLKSSYKAHIPLFVIVDFNIIIHAPMSLIAAGVADLFARSSIETDQFVSSLILNTHYHPNILKDIFKYEEKLLNNADKIINRDFNIIKILMIGLLVTGDYMAIMGGSSIASQGEHQIAHLMGSIFGYDNLHGHEIAVTILTNMRIQDRIIENLTNSKILFSFPDDDDFKRKLISVFNKNIPIKSMLEVFQRKKRQFQSLNDIDDIKITLPFIRHNNLHDFFQKLLLPIAPIDLGWNNKLYNEAVNYAFTVRDRNSCLDIAFFLGIK